MSVGIENNEVGFSEMSSEEKRSMVKSICFRTGAVAGLKVLAVSVPAVLLAVKFSPGFRKTFGVSGRTALAIMPPLGAFGAVSERQASLLSHPMVLKAEIEKVQAGPIALHHRVANYIHDHPFNTIISLGVPTVMGIFLYMGTETHLKFSQRVMHTRVLGQASILALLAGTMAFHDYMDRRGPYKE